MRETWEETGLAVDLVRIVGVFGGAPCVSEYGNGDRVAWVSTVFEGAVVGGELRPDGEETLDVRYFDRASLDKLDRRPHVDLFVDAALRSVAGAVFQPATWTPPIR